MHLYGLPPTLAHLRQGQSLIIGPQQIALHLGVGEQGIEPVGIGEVLPPVNARMVERGGQQGGRALGVGDLAGMLQDMERC